MTFSFSIIVDAWPIFASGLLVTIVFCAVATVLGLVFAVPIALAQLSKSPWWRMPARVLVEVIRDTPFLVQVFVIYFVLPAFGMPISTTAAGILALSVYGAVYFSESIRGAILSVPKGQVDAARATGMSYLLAMRKIVFPQMLGYALPPLGNQVIGLIKDSCDSVDHRRARAHHGFPERARYDLRGAGSFRRRDRALLGADVPGRVRSGEARAAHADAPFDVGLAPRARRPVTPSCEGRC